MRKTIGRRMFLLGAGGAIMAVPFMPSLLSRAFASEPATGTVPKRFLAMSTMLGEVWGKNMYPDEALLTESLEYAGRMIRYGDLPTQANASGRVEFSPVCSADATLMTPALAGKFNVLRGLDIPYNLGHHEGVHLGNFAGNFARATGGIPSESYLHPTMDQVIAYSPGFYSATELSEVMTQRSFRLGASYMSWNYTSPSTKTGDVIKLPTQSNNLAFYDYLFAPGTSVGSVDTFIVDRVKGSYDRLKQDPRISKGDLQRLEQHTERMFEIERKLQVAEAFNQQELAYDRPTVNSSQYTEDLAFQGTPYQMIAYTDLMIDIIVAAFHTGASRVGTWAQTSKFTDVLVNDWHGNVSHNGFGATIAQEYAVTWNQGTFEHAFTKLASKLDDIPMEDGGSLLDHSLLMLTNEAGQQTHHSGCLSYPVVTAGSAGGYFQTGHYVDYSDQTKVYGNLAAVMQEKPGIQLEGPGLYYQQFLANALMAMGVPQSEWEPYGRELTTLGPNASEPTGGFGFHYVNPSRAADYALAKQQMSDKLPVISQAT